MSARIVWAGGRWPHRMWCRWRGHRVSDRYPLCARCRAIRWGGP